MIALNSVSNSCSLTNEQPTWAQAVVNFPETSEERRAVQAEKGAGANSGVVESSPPSASHLVAEMKQQLWPQTSFAFNRERPATPSSPVLMMPGHVRLPSPRQQLTHHAQTRVESMPAYCTLYLGGQGQAWNWM